MKVIAVLALVAIAGCASVQQAINGYAAAAAVSVRAAEDENIRVWTADACGTPYAAALRNPQIIPALRDLCGTMPLLGASEAPLVPSISSDAGVPK